MCNDFLPNGAGWRERSEWRHG